MTRIDNIKHALSVLKPKYLEVIDESHLHSGHFGPGNDVEFSHIKIVISDEFPGKKLVEKHRTIKSLLKEEFESGLHALSIVITI